MIGIYDYHEALPVPSFLLPIVFYILGCKSCVEMFAKRKCAHMALDSLFLSTHGIHAHEFIPFHTWYYTRTHLLQGNFPKSSKSFPG
jgi:hypothetical protein